MATTCPRPPPCCWHSVTGLACCSPGPHVVPLPPSHFPPVTPFKQPLTSANDGKKLLPRRRPPLYSRQHVRLSKQKFNSAPAWLEPLSPHPHPPHPVQHGQTFWHSFRTQTPLKNFLFLSSACSSDALLITDECFNASSCLHHPSYGPRACIFINIRYYIRFMSDNKHRKSQVRYVLKCYLYTYTCKGNDNRTAHVKTINKYKTLGSKTQQEDY